MAFFAKITTYLRESIAEMRKVVWPTRTQLINYTIIVIAMSIGIALFFAGLDYVFSYLLELLIS